MFSNDTLSKESAKLQSLRKRKLNQINNSYNYRSKLQRSSYGKNIYSDMSLINIPKFNSTLRYSHLFKHEYCIKKIKDAFRLGSTQSNYSLDSELKESKNGLFHNFNSLCSFIDNHIPKLEEAIYPIELVYDYHDFIAVEFICYLICNTNLYVHK